MNKLSCQSFDAAQHALEPENAGSQLNLREGTDMATQYSLAHLTVLGCPPPEMTYIAARAGYDFVSIRPILMGLQGEPNYALADNPAMMKQTKQGARRNRGPAA